MKAGSQISGKRKKLRAVILACAALALAWLGAHPDAGAHAAARIRHRVSPIRADRWMEFPGIGDTYAVAGDTIFAASGGELLACGMDGTMRWRQETDWESPVLETWGGFALAYEPGGNTLYLADRHQCSVLKVPTGADAAAPGPEGQIAVLTSGSGYLTELKVFGRDGTLLRTEAFADRAAAGLTYLRRGALALCCVSREGAWSLWLEGQTIPLETEVVCDMASWGDGIALWTCGGLMLFDASGVPAGSLRAEGLDWACGDAAALLVFQEGAYRIWICARDGTVSRSGPLPRKPLRLTVCKDFVCVLDRESLRIYDDRGTLREEDSSGAGAAHILSWGDGQLLVGDGRLLVHWNP